MSLWCVRFSSGAAGHRQIGARRKVRAFARFGVRFSRQPTRARRFDRRAANHRWQKPFLPAAFSCARRALQPVSGRTQRVFERSARGVLLADSRPQTGRLFVARRFNCGGRGQPRAGRRHRQADAVGALQTSSRAPLMPKVCPARRVPETSTTYQARQSEPISRVDRGDHDFIQVVIPRIVLHQQERPRLITRSCVFPPQLPAFPRLGLCQVKEMAALEPTISLCTTEVRTGVLPSFRPSNYILHFNFDVRGDIRALVRME